MSQLYDALKLFDAGIAALYFQATGDKPKVKITKAYAEKIFDLAMKDKVIQNKEASALTQLLVFGNFTGDAAALIIDKLTEKVFVDEALEKAAPDKALRSEIAHALSGAVTSQVMFVSPYTTISYDSSLYARVWELIDTKEVEVWALPAGSLGLMSALNGGTAEYRSDLDRLLLPDWSFGFPPFYPLVVHEATHVIQDWLDRKDMPHWHIETDAYVAGAIAQHTLNLPSSENARHPERVAHDQIGTLRKDKKALAGRAFQKACEAVYDAVSKHILYKDKKDVKFGDLAKDKKRPRTEAQLLQDLLDKAKKAAATAKP